MSLLELLDFSEVAQPEDDDDIKGLLMGWLEYQRAEFRRKWRDLDAPQITSFAVPPVELSVLGLIRHMTQMEDSWITAGLAGSKLVMRYGEDDYAGGTSETLEADLKAYLEAVEQADEVISGMSLGDLGLGHGRSLGWTLIKMIDEYAIHAGQAHMIRFAALGEIRR